MMLRKYEPWSAVHELHNELNRAFGRGPRLANLREAGDEKAWVPAVDIREEDGRFVIVADVPGVDPKDIEVTTERGVLTISGERNVTKTDDAKPGYTRTERIHGSFYRQFTLPESADGDQVSASGKNGVLEVVVPKKAAVQPRRIEVAA